jgi:hypothetical protein
MKKTIIGMEKIFKQAAVITGIILFMLMFSTCKDNFESLPEQPEMVEVTINIMNNNGRTIYPSLNYAVYKLSVFNKDGNCYNDDVKPGETIHIPSGTWNFDLRVGISDPITDELEERFYARLDSQIVQRSRLTLTFDLKIVSYNGVTENGFIYILFKFPSYAGITKVVAVSDKELPEMTKNILTNNYEQIFNGSGDFFVDNNEQTFSFIKDFISAPDDYFISFEFWRGDSERVRVISEVVKVWPNLASTDEIDVNIYEINVPDYLTDEATESNLVQKLEWISRHQQNCDNVEYIVKVGNNEEFTKAITLSSNEKITITLMQKGSAPALIKFSFAEQGALFTVKTNVTLILHDDITLAGNTSIPHNSALVVVDGGTFIMNNGTIKDNNNTNNGSELNGGGVCVNGGGTFIMNGGKISGNHGPNGGGVFVDNYGTFIMRNGTIEGNKASYGGGVFVSLYGTFKKTKGTIYGDGSPSTEISNTADMNGKVVCIMYSTTSIDIIDSTVNAGDSLSYEDRNATPANLWMRMQI